MIRETLADEQGSVRELHDNYRKQLRALEVQEERLLDLATDGELPRDRIKARLRKIQIDRGRAEEGLTETAESLGVGAQTLETYIQLLNEPARLYRASPEPIRRQLNDAFFERL